MNEARNKRILYAESEGSRSQWVAALSKAARSRSLEDHYVVEWEKPIGKGKFSTVYPATHILSGSTVAVKIIKNANIQLQRDREFIRTEVAIAKLVRHPNIVKTMDVFESISNIYVVMEWIKGGDLLSKLLSSPDHKLTGQLAAKVARGILLALDYLHRHGIAHRDIKGENILVVCSADGSLVDVKLTDFGLSAISAHGNSMEAQLGTVEYAAPEIILKYHYDKSVDLWSLGVVTFVMLSGRLPFSGPNDRETALNIVKGRFSFPGEGWDLDAVDFIKKLIVRNPSSRMSVADALKHKWILKHGESAALEHSLGLVTRSSLNRGSN